MVTGTLTMRGNTEFQGRHTRAGTGKLIRNGGGNGDILGGITIAAFGRIPATSRRRRSRQTVAVTQPSSTIPLALSNGVGSATNVSGIREF